MSSEATTGTSPFDRFFRISERGSTVAREIRGGVVTFFTMAYIVVLNPIILGFATDIDGNFLGADPGEGPNLAAIAAGTALVAGVLTILMGVVANYPLALATGLGLNAFVTFGIAKLPEMTWADAMGLIVIEGVIILVLVLTGFRQAVFRAVPAQLKVAISVGIGLFITIIGLVDAGFVRRTGTGPVPVELGIAGTLNGWPLLVFVVGLLAIIIMMVRRIKGAILYGIIGATVLAVIVEAIGNVGGQFDATGKFVNPAGWGLNVPALPDQVVDVPDFSLLGNFNLLGSFSAIGFVAAVLLVFTLLLADFFDTMGTMVAVGAEGNLLDKNGNPPNSDKILLVDSVAAIAGGAASASSATTYIESASGVGVGGRTGWVSVVTGALFFPFMFLAPIIGMVPPQATAAALIIVGWLMISVLTELEDEADLEEGTDAPKTRGGGMKLAGIDFHDVALGLSAALILMLMPFTFSITDGIGFGFIAYVVIRSAQGAWNRVNPLMWVSAAAFALYFLIPLFQDQGWI